MDAKPVKMDIYRSTIPMRGFEHAAARRSAAEAVVVRVSLGDRTEGWGETLPREYVTGETIESVIADLRESIWPAVTDGQLPPPNRTADGRCINAASCAAELALLDATLRSGAARRSGVMGDLAEAARRRTPIRARVSGVLGSADPDRTRRRLRLMRWFGLRDFKLKLGFGADVDGANLDVVTARLGPAIAAGKCTLRVDVNGGWDPATTPQRVAELARLGVCVVEQPVFVPPGELAELARACALPLMADESLLTIDDARTLADQGGAKVWWNVRISKNGGLLRAVELARLAGERGVPFVVGCMVGESGILSIAQRRLLQVCPRPRFVEGNYGRFLLGDDLARTSPRFGYGGRLRRPRGPGATAPVDAGKLAAFAERVDTLTA